MFQGENFRGAVRDALKPLMFLPRCEFMGEINL
jgi:hypothetical protein